MHRLVEDFQKLNNVKLSLKTIAESEGKDMSNVPFAQYNDVFSTLIGKPTLNTPSIEFNANGGYMYIIDKNGDFDVSYDLYLNDEKSTTLTGTSYLMQDLGISETDEIGIVAVGELFNPSEMAVSNWNTLTYGSIGLEYDGSKCLGIGTATGEEIYIAGIVNDVIIKSVSGTSAFYGIDGKTIYMPNSLTTIDNGNPNDTNNGAFRGCTNCRIVFGASFKKTMQASLMGCKNCVFDFRKTEQIPNIGLYAPNGWSEMEVVVPDHLYDEWIVASVWSGQAKFIIKASVWEAQQGGSV